MRVSHDEPAEWALMLTMYVDESREESAGLWVVAGYLGNKEQWTDYASQWAEALKPKTSLHLARLRLASSWAPNRYGALLERLSLVPRRCGLTPYVASVWDQSYMDTVRGTSLEPLMNGYVMSVVAVIESVLKRLPPGKRLEVIFEEQLEFAAQRARAMDFIYKQSQYRGRKNRPILAKFSSTPKTILTEASDYLAYAFLQNYLDNKSQKAILTEPMLSASGPLVWNSRDESIKETIINIKTTWAKKGRFVLPINAAEKKRIRGWIRTGQK